MRKIIYQGKYLTTSTEKIDGHTYERVKLRAGLKIIPIDELGRILFIREYRTHEKKSRLKLIGGWKDKKKSSLAMAKDELREEVSMEAEEWLLFHTLTTTNQTIEEQEDFFVAKKLKILPKQINPDSNIVEEIIFLTEKEIIQKMKSYEIVWDKDMAVIWMWLSSKKNK